MSTQITDKKSPMDSIKSLLSNDQIQRQIALALPRHMTAERFCRIAITAISKQPKLAQCTKASLMRCLLDLSSLGLEPDDRRCYLIPYEDKKNGVMVCQLQLSYKGIVELVRRDPNVVDVQVITIRNRDHATVKNGVMEHSYSPIEERGEVMAVYTKISWASGLVSYSEPMTRSEMEAVRERSQAWQSWLKYKKEGPWNTDEVEMWKKTAVKRDAKMWTLTPEIADAIVRDDEVAGMRNITPQADRIELDPAPATNPFAAALPAIAQPAEVAAAEPQTEELL